MSTEDTDSESTASRRTYLGALSAAAGGALAGCFGGGDRITEHEPGEPVPRVQLTSMTGVAGESGIEQAHSHLKDVLEDHLGIPASIETKEITTMWDEMYNDQRAFNFHMDLMPAVPDILEPDTTLPRFRSYRAGANGLDNETQYANCEFDAAVNEESRTADEDERRERVHEAMSIWSEDVHTINLFPMVAAGAYRTDQIDVGDPGSQGLNDRNVDLFIHEAEPIGDNDIVMNGPDTMMQSSTYMVNDPLMIWSSVIHSSLVYYDKENELQPYLATDWEIEDEARRYTFSLREDATFHNGDPITAEDVKFTFEFLNENTAQFSKANEHPYESIEAVDDHTVEFTFEEPYPAFLNGVAPKWGIVPRDVYLDGGAEENPANVDLDPIVGSGPYQITNFRRGEGLQAEPYDDHWVDTEGDLVLQVYGDGASTLRAFESGDINIFSNMASNFQANVEENMQEEAEVIVEDQFTDWWVLPQLSHPVSQFREFRLAFSHAIDREFLNQLMNDGDAEPHLYSSPFGKQHPFYPEDAEGLTRIAESASGDPDRAREILEDAGWTWNDDDRLVYPDDIDTDPRWPQGDTPADHPNEYSCAEGQGS